MSARRATPRVLWIGSREPGDAVCAALHDHGYLLLRLEAGDAALAACRRLRHDAIVLALASADDALRTLRDVRAQADPAPLVVLLPRLAPIDEVLLLGAGADLVADAGASALVLLARLRGCLRRARGEAGPTGGAVRLGRLEVDGEQGWLRLDGQVLPLGASAAALLEELVARDGLAATRADLARRLGTAGVCGLRSRTVDMAISRLRRALRAVGARELAIESVRGRGYRMVLRAPARPRTLS